MKNMLVTLLVATTSTVSGAQAPPATGTARDFALQLAVPASPAFKLVELSEPSILHPTSFQQLTTSLGDMAGGPSTFQLPKQVGVEFAPFYVARGQSLSLQDYARDATLYRTRVSGAYKRGSGATDPTLLAMGIRLAPIDATDARTDPEFIRALTALTASIAAVCADQAAIRPEPDDEPGIVSCADPHGREAGLAKRLSTLAVNSAQWESTQRALVAFRESKAVAQTRIDRANTAITKLKKDWTDKAWNRNGFEVALAGSAQSPDTLGRSPEFRSVAAWLAGAIQVSDWGQLVYGINAASGRDSIRTSVHQSASIGLGLYAGSARYKGFAESQASYKSITTDGLGALVSTGAEIYIGGGLWGRGTAGWTLDPGTHAGRLTSSFTIKAKFPSTTDSDH